jgi:hypothetical protein
MVSSVDGLAGAAAVGSSGAAAASRSCVGGGNGGWLERALARNFPWNVYANLDEDGKRRHKIVLMALLGAVIILGFLAPHW